MIENIVRVTAGLVGLVLGGFVVHGEYAYGLLRAGGEDYRLALYFGSASAAAVYLPALAHFQWRSRRWLAIAASLVAIAGAGFSCVAGLGFLNTLSGHGAAQREKHAQGLSDAKKELERITGERTSLRFSPTTQDAVDAAQAAVSKADDTAKKECGDSDETRGKNCRLRETDAATRRTELANALKDLNATTAAKSLDDRISELKGKIEHAAPAEHPDPLAEFIAQFNVSISWFNLSAVLIAEAFIALLVAQLHVHQGAVSADAPIGDAPRFKQKKSSSTSQIAKVLTSLITPARRGRVEAAELYAAYVEKCRARHLTPMSTDDFGPQWVEFCRSSGIELEADDDKVFMTGVRLSA